MRLDFNPDVIETPEWRAEGLVLAMRRSCPVVIRLHSAAEQLFAFSGRAGLDARLSFALERRSILAADLVVSTASNLQDLAARMPGHALTTRASSLPVPDHGPAGPLPAVPRVTFVGRLERCKNPETLLSAAGRVLERIPQARFSFAGADTGTTDGSYLHMLNGEARRLGVDHAVEFLGHCSHPDVIELMHRSWLCAFPARQETFGYGAAEAASVGRAVVASRIPAYVSLFGDREAAELADAEDVEGWATAIIRLLSNPDWATKLGQAGRERVRSSCAPERIAAQMLDAYQQARTEARRPSVLGRTRLGVR
jgi:glycosyltransferase involved in cell wall biosynthesis